MRAAPTTEDRWAGRVQVGEMWLAPWLLKGGQPTSETYLSTTYINERMAHRAPLMVRLPGGIDFCLDSRADCPGGEVGWTVTGEPPHITVSPSINVMRTYHGFIRQGVITDDCEGRTFEHG